MPTVSRPFAKPDAGRIVVTVINHYGDEVLKVFTLANNLKSISVGSALGSARLEGGCYL